MSFLKKLFGKQTNEIGSPLKGTAVSIKEVNDPTFSEEILGKGIAIRPAEGKVYAPCDASVDMIFETGHAVSLVADCGAELLIHVGLDTVNLKGKHFTTHAKAGDKVSKGTLLIEFDKDAIIAEGYDIITPVVICNSSDFSTFLTHPGEVQPGDCILEVAK